MNTYLVLQGGRNQSQTAFDAERKQEDDLRNADFVHVCGGPGKDQSQWWKEGFSEEDKALESLPLIIEVSETEKNPFE